MKVIIEGIVFIAILYIIGSFLELFVNIAFSKVGLIIGIIATIIYLIRTPPRPIK